MPECVTETPTTHPSHPRRMTEAANDYSSSRYSKFRFKSKRARADDGDDLPSHHRSKRHRSGDRDDRHAHRHRHRSKRRAPSPSPTGANDDPTLYDDTYMPNARSSQYLDPDAAFRESLFDALADDEGAAYWESVYGQPIHTYADTRAGPAGELERMTDDEYAAYVRGRMYERTHQAVLEERERREEERRRQREWRERTMRMEADRGVFEMRVEESLRRGEERRARKRWEKAWERYTRGWEELVGRTARVQEGAGGEGKKLARDVVPWPVESAKWKDVSRDEVEDFFRNAPPAGTAASVLLKAERVRWHPDKMQQRFGEQGVDAETMKSVTAVFQVIDRMWADVRDQKGNS